ncbi:ATP-binding protein [Profundibacterium mesophilum]|uniref:histidine kinase n=1 Tax=Profundibacterium mesophilum KAUST100406-0324 TaxID=1037889 RepID=A0A921TDR0_9RHOB|nr:ATP-binding protein [Profundibacterium mesophilum]KAF0676482.1 two-component system cell cycle sensor histidine kinase PleC [Profundibacterium mesophilum KAUST100406-0324]
MLKTTRRFDPANPGLRAGLIGATVALVLATGLWIQQSRISAQRVEARLDLSQEVSALAARIEGNLLSKYHLLNGMIAMIRLERELTDEVFRVTAETLHGNNPEILNIAVAPDLVVTQVYPLEPNSSLIGFDYRGSVQYDAARATIDEGRPVMVGPLELIQGGSGYIIRAPVFSQAGIRDPETAWGIVSIVLDAPRFHAAVGLNTGTMAAALRRVERDGSAGPAFFGPPEIFPGDPITQTITLPFGTWELAARPIGGWPDNLETPWRHWTFFAALAALAATLLHFILILSERRRRAEDRMFNAIEAIDDGFALYDSEDRLVSCNQKYREIYTLSSDLMVPGMPFETIIREGVRRGQYPEATGREEDWIAERLQSHRDADQIIVQQIASGRWLKVAERRTSDGGIVGFRVDITALTEAKELAERASRAKTDFINVLSHELRTPMTVVLGYTSILANPQLFRAAREFEELMKHPEPDPDEMRRRGGALLTEMSSFARKIEGSGNQLLSLINELLDFSKIEAGEIEIDLIDFDLADAAEAAAEQFKALAQRKNVTITCDMPGIRVHADPKRTQQVFANLLSNALKFTDSGHVDICATQNGDIVFVTVEDTGCGIPAGLQSKVFEEFQQADSSSTRRAGGTGLGLAIVKRIVERLGGTVSLNSTPGQGTKITFTLPCAVAASQTHETARRLLA